jgi:hypothetical protein
VVDSQKLDLNRYLGEPLENLDKFSNVLAWWRVSSPRFPTPGKMARDFLAIPISATVSKSSFSGAVAFNGFRL